MSESQRLSILIVEDQVALAQNISDYLEACGHSTDFAYTGPQGVRLGLENLYDLVILDLMLPGLDGLSVCEQLRNQADRHIPILMLTARDTLEDKVVGFKQGADDYLTKPFALEELHMRCLALSRREQLHKEKVITLGELKLDLNTKQAFRQQTPLKLNSMSFRILAILAEAHPRVVTRSELSHKIWGDEPTESDALRSHIYQLRQAVDKPFDSALIRTLHGVGFSLDIKDD